MISETSALASRLARWSGSLDKNGLSGRLAPGGVLVLTADGEGAGEGVSGGENGVGAAGATGACALAVTGAAGRGGGTYGGVTGGVNAVGAGGAGGCGELGVENGDESQAPCVGAADRGRC